MHRITIALACAVAAIGVTACGESTLDTDKGEDVIAKDLTKSAGEKVTVDCPSDVKAKKGGTFTCKAKSASGQDATITVTQKDDDGNISWKVG